MSIDLSHIFPESDRERIQHAVEQAERGTSGEIVPVVVPRSDGYHDTAWRCAAFVGAIALLALALGQRFAGFWMPLGLTGVALVAIIAAALTGVAVAFVPALTRLFSSQATLTRRTAQRAMEAFVSEEVFNTRERTGILIFLSLLERRVVILGDSGINSKVSQGEWEGIVSTIVAGIRSGRPTDAVIEAIGTCGKLLALHGVALRPDDTNELGDSLRFGSGR
jgi:putative membrane protein